MDEMGFLEACIALAAKAHQMKCDMKIDLVDSTTENDKPYLSIVKTNPIKQSTSGADQISTIEEGQLEEQIEDDIIYPQTENRDAITVEYNILFSQSYQVPVLYFDIRMDSTLAKSKLDSIYEYLVPSTRSHELQQAGVLGGISQINHPVTGIPCFYIHPCRTAEAMESLIAGQQVSSLEYLQTWIGLIGSAVSLNLPKELAM